MPLPPEPNPEERQHMVDDALRELAFKDNKPEVVLARKYDEMHKRVHQAIINILMTHVGLPFDREALVARIIPFYRDEIKSFDQEEKDILLATYYAIWLANRL